MLPRRLSTDLCSLRPGEVRDVVTAEMLVRPDGTVDDARFFRAAILSRERLTYPGVDAVLAGAAQAPPGLEEAVTLAAEAARRLHARRMARGALEVTSGEPAFTIGPDRVESAVVEGQTPAHSLVEECMIAANEAVARFMVARKAPTVFRYHEDPAGPPVLRLYEQLEELGVPLPPIADGPLGPQQAREAVSAAAEALGAHIVALGEDGARAASALWGLLLRSLRQAYYTPDHVGHSGLASAAYLHFTSPIRRYPDLLVHRGLLDQLGIGDPGPDASTCAEAAAHSSSTERDAVGIERRADRVALALLLERLLGERAIEIEQDGTVTGVVDAGLFVAFGDVFDGFLPVRRLGGDWYRTHPLDIGLVGEGTGRRVMIGDPIRVRVVRVEALRGRVELEPAALGPSRALTRRRARLGGR
jgi:ribonuclease R